VHRPKLKKHHKVILMSAIGVLAFSLPFFGSLQQSINQRLTSGTIWPCGSAMSPYPTLTPRTIQLTCSTCPSKTLCFSKSEKRAYCQNATLNAIPQASDTTCVSCTDNMPSPTPQCGPYRLSPQGIMIKSQIPCY